MKRLFLLIILPMLACGSDIGDIFGTYTPVSTETGTYSINMSPTDTLEPEATEEPFGCVPAEFDAVCEVSVCNVRNEPVEDIGTVAYTVPFQSILNIQEICTYPDNMIPMWYKSGNYYVAGLDTIWKIHD